MLDARVATIVLGTCAVQAAGLNQVSVLLIYLFGWLTLDVLLRGKITEVGLVPLLLAWTVLLCWAASRVQAEASQTARRIVLPMVVGGIAAFVSPALLLSRLAAVSGKRRRGSRRS